MSYWRYNVVTLEGSVAERRLLCVIGGVIILIFCTGSELANARSRGHDKAWCTQANTGASRVRKNCVFDSFEACRRTVISGNRGFCTRNPAYVPR